MQHLEVSSAVQPIYGSLGVKRLRMYLQHALLQVYCLQGAHEASFKTK